MAGIGARLSLRNQAIALKAQSGRLTTTLRLPSKQQFQPGETVMLTVGWPDEKHFEELHSATIESVQRKKLAELTENDLVGESPDCLAVNAVPYVLGAIYRKVLSLDDPVVIIKFRHST